MQTGAIVLGIVILLIFLFWTYGYLRRRTRK
jgi:hypothetical protein